MTSKLTKVDCPKCSGRGHIEAFGHYAQGVCFGCNGAGTIKVDLEVKKASVPQETRTRCEFVLNADHETFAGLSYARLLHARNFAHNYVMCPGAKVAYPGVLDAWREFGEPHFQEAQERKLQEFYGR
jgi:hypothetical protein